MCIRDRQVIAAEIAETTAYVLRMAVERGSGKRAEVPGYDVAGKTGTAQLVEHGRYSHSKMVTSFAGFAPKDDPKMAALLVLWEPQGAFYGGIIASPVFARLAEEVLTYLGVERKATSRAVSYTHLDVYKRQMQKPRRRSLPPSYPWTKSSSSSACRSTPRWNGSRKRSPMKTPGR